MNIPDEVIERALDATDILEPSYTEDLTEAVEVAARVIAEWAFERAAVEAWNIGMKYAPGSQHDAIMRIPSRLRELSQGS